VTLKALNALKIHGTVHTECSYTERFSAVPRNNSLYMVRVDNLRKVVIIHDTEITLGFSFCNAACGRHAIFLPP